MSAERGVRVGRRHVAHPLPEGVDLCPLPVRRQALRGPQRVVDHGVLLHGIPQPVGHLHRLEDRAVPLAQHVGHGSGLRRLRRRVAAPLTVPRPPLRLATDHHGHLGGAGEHGGQGIVDEALLGDPELDQVRRRPRCPDPDGHDAGGIRVGPAALGDRHPVHPRPSPRPPASASADRRGVRHELRGLGVRGCRADTDEHRRAGVEAGAHRAASRGHADRRRACRPTAVRRSRSIRPRSRQVTSTAPLATASDRARSGRS